MVRTHAFYIFTTSTYTSTLACLAGGLCHNTGWRYQMCLAGMWETKRARLWEQQEGETWHWLPGQMC